MKALIVRLWNAEPVAIVAGALFVVYTVTVQLLDNGLITSDFGKNLAHAVIGIALAIGAWIARGKVSPVQ
jgi:hypothetical protein